MMTEKNLSDNPIVVSISCITYNHAPYIRQCLDGFMMQQTNFAFEVLIHDDASTDGTIEIIKEYEAKYPDIIKPIYEEENQWVKGRRGSTTFNFPRARGKYIALCEGDDYWTDPLKLQKQVDILEKNIDVSIVFCRVQAVSKDKTSLGWTIPNCRAFKEGLITLEDYIKEEFFYGRWAFHTSSVLFRNDTIRYQLAIDNDYKLFPHGDMSLMLYYLSLGYGYYMSECCSHYRLFSGGYNSNVSNNRELKRKDSLRKIAALQFYDMQTQNKYHKYINRGIKRQEFDLERYERGKKVLFKPKYYWLLWERIINKLAK